MTHTITLIPGDGIGPEVTEAVLRVLHAAGVAIDWDRHDAGVLAFERTGRALPAELLDSIRRNKVALKGPVTTPIAEGFTSVNVGLRKALDLYANLRPVSNLPGVQSRFTNVDIIIVRENTEDLYAGFEYARANGRRTVTAIHKANIMKLSDGLFLESTRKVSKEFIDIAYDERIVDAVCMQLVMRPEKFDVLVLPNLYGDIVSDLCAGLVGGLGVVPGANIGKESAVFEAVHGSAPDIADKNLANPTALLLSALMMLEHIGEAAKAERIRAALGTVLVDGRVRTRDLGGQASTTEFTDAVCREIER